MAIPISTVAGVVVYDVAVIIMGDDPIAKSPSEETDNFDPGVEGRFITPLNGLEVNPPNPNPFPVPLFLSKGNLVLLSLSFPLPAMFEVGLPVDDGGVINCCAPLLMARLTFFVDLILSPCMLCARLEGDDGGGDKIPP